MNDRGNQHLWGGTQAIGLEARVHAYAYDTGQVEFDQATFYHYDFVYRGDAPFEAGSVGLWSDVDLGSFSDDYVGSDPELGGLGFFYNGDSIDEGSEGYGDRPPAQGIRASRWSRSHGPCYNSDDFGQRQPSLMVSRRVRLPQRDLARWLAASSSAATASTRAPRRSTSCTPPTRPTSGASSTSTETARPTEPSDRRSLHRLQRPRHASARRHGLAACRARVWTDE